MRECHCLKWERDTRGMVHRLESARRRLAMATFSHIFSYSIMAFLALLAEGETAHARPPLSLFIYRRPTLYPLEIAVDFLKSL